VAVDKICPLPLKNGRGFRTQNKATMVNHPPASFSYEWLPSRAAARDAAQSLSSADSGERSVAARRSWAAPGLSSGRFFVAATAIYSVFRRNLEIPHQSAGWVF